MGANINHISLEGFILSIILPILSTVLSLFIDITIDYHSPVMLSNTLISSLTFIRKTFFKK